MQSGADILRRHAPAWLHAASRDRRARRAAGIALIALLAAVAYVPSLRGGFLLDDDSLLTNSRLIRAPDGLQRFWFTTEAVDYWPLTNSSFWIEWRLWGLDPTGYRITNLLLHIVSACLIWAILARMDVPGSYLAALLFAVHPLNVQSVAWISQRKNTLAMLFFLLALLAYLRSEPGPRQSLPAGAPNRWYWLALAAFALAMLSKGSVAVLPALLLVVLWWMRPLTWRDLLRVVPFVVVSGALVAVTLFFQARTATPLAWQAGILERVLGAGGVIWFYIAKTVLPLRLSFIYPRWHIDPSDWRWWLALAAAVACTAALWLLRRRVGKGPLAAWAWYCIALVPAMGFTYVVFMAEHSLVADHYQHVALIGALAFAGGVWGTARNRASPLVRGALLGLAIVMVTDLTTVTTRQSALYRDAVTLFGAALANHPDSMAAHNNFGFVLLQAGDPDAAREQFEAALRIDPDAIPPRNNLGAALAQLGRYDDAIAQFEEAARRRPNDPAAYQHLGAALRESGRPQQALEPFEAALALRSNFPEARYGLASALYQLGRRREAIEQFRLALGINPDFAEAHNGLGAALLESGQMDEAIAHLREAVRLAPEHGGARANLERALTTPSPLAGEGRDGGR